MEFPFSVDFLEFEFNVIEKDLKVRDASKIGPLRDLPHDEQHRCVRSSSRVQERLGLVIDALGKASCAAQGLPAPVTTSDRLQSSGHRVYVLVEPNARGGAVLGLLKVGFKQLFLRDGHSRLCQVRPLCLLDFYVQQSRQRQGYGRRLFDRMAQTEQIAADQLAIDQPSEKMLAFMERHFSLTQPLPQSNHFAVFPGFFQASIEQPRPPEQHVSTEKIVRARVRRPHSLDSSLVGSCLDWPSYEGPQPASRSRQVYRGRQPLALKKASSTKMQGRATEARGSWPTPREQLQPRCSTKCSSSWGIFGLSPPDHCRASWH
ncbi:alpha-tubulin N-acetyltransferase 1 isoform X1 [Dermacentor silvarum]|uniref:alpha-tubulin N-acetyltransferase 1 isoform X1 n=1 Tax=Dermacentor silvarum TaxID=543639 RepID=UPI00189955F9|nr:alpha-tubulin N-acetyltransferase 1 isoform X1 [Dermacentor silvarum]